MVRTYQRKTDKPRWSRETLRQAVDAVRLGLSGYKAAKTYGIPRKTIMDHVTGRRGQKSSTQGRPPALSAEIEVELANCLHIMERHGFGLSRKEVLELVGEYVKINKINTPFTNDIPGNDWFSNFMTRHRLSIKKPQAVEIARKKAADPFIIQEFYNIVEKVIKELGLENKPERIYNIDETSYCSDPQKTKVVGLKGYPSTRTTSSAGKANTTVLVASNAAGGKGPPFIIFKGKHVWSGWTSEEAYPGTLYTATSNGWIESEAFAEFMVKSFIPMVKNEKDPTLLIYDGHSTHVQLTVVEKAKENNITIIKLPPHSSHLLQPLDLSVFKPYKDAWDQEMVKWQRTHKGEKLPKDQFSAIVGRVWKNLNSNVIKKGFEKSGIYPFNRNAVPEHKLDPEALKRWKKHQENLSKEQTLACSSPLTLTKLCLNKINSYIKVLSIPVTILPNVSSSEKTSFEDLLIQSTKQSQTGNIKRKKVKISASAEVITHQDVIERLKQKEDDKAKKEKEKEEKLKLRQQKKKDIISKQNEKINKEKVKKSDENSKNIRLRKIMQSHVTDPTSSKATLSEINLPDSDLNIRDQIHSLQDDSSILNCLASSSKSLQSHTSKPKVAILEDRYLNVDEKLTKDIFTGHKIKRPADFTLEGTDEKHIIKKGSTRIITDIPGKNELEEEARKREEKKRKNSAKIVKRKFKDTTSKPKRAKKGTKAKRQRRNSKDSASSEEDVILPPSPESVYSIEDEIEENSEEEEDDGKDIDKDDIREHDWVVINFVSQRSIPHRYVGQVVNESLASLDIKFAKKIDDKRFKWPEKLDSSIIAKYQVVKKLPPPTFKSTSKRIGTFEFPKSLRQFKIDK